MKGIVLAGGNGTRLRPLTQVVNKHLLPVGKQPMICYSIEQMRAAGITDVLLVIGKQSAGLFIDLLGSGKQWGVNISYVVQETAGGIAQAVAAGEGFIKAAVNTDEKAQGNVNEKFIVMLGDNLFGQPITDWVNAFAQLQDTAMVLIRHVDDPRRYGVPVFDGDRMIRIEEKPLVPKSNYCVVGLYMYDASVFEIIRTLQPSARGELEITDVNNVYAAKGQLAYARYDGWWSDAGTFRSLYEAGYQLMFGGETG